MWFQYLCQHKHLPEFERFLAIEPADKIVAPMNRSRDLLPNWFSIFEELRSKARLPPQLRHTNRLASKSVSCRPAHKVPFDSKKVDNRQTVRGLLTESANVARAATASIIPEDRLRLGLPAASVAVSQPVPSSDVILHAVDVAAPAAAAHNDVLILTTDQLHQLGLNGSMVPPVSTCNVGLVDTSVVHCGNSPLPEFGSVPVNHEIPSPEKTTVMSSSNLIGQAFASAVGISVDQLSNFADVEFDDSRWHMPSFTSSQMTPTKVLVPEDAVGRLSGNDVTVTVNDVTVTASEKPVTTSVASVDTSFSHSLGCEDVDITTIDITMLNNSLSPDPPSQHRDLHFNNDSTLATPKKMGSNLDDEIVRPVPVAEAKTKASDDPGLLPHGSDSAVITGSERPVSSDHSEARVSVVSGSSTPAVFTGTVSLGEVTELSSVSFVNLVPVPSPEHGMALISSTHDEMLSALPGSDDAMPTTAVSLASSSSALPIEPSPPRMQRIPTHHMRSSSKRVPSRPILPQNELSFSPSKFLSSLSPPKTKKKKSAAKVRSKTSPAIAPKTVVAKTYLSPLKQVAASITARAKRHHNSPSRSFWSTLAIIQMSESPGVADTLATSEVINSPGSRTLVNDDDDDVASGDGEEQSMSDVDSQLEDDELDEEAVSAEQSPSLYVQSLKIMSLKQKLILY